MAERFYSIHPEESSNIFVNYNVAQMPTHQPLNNLSGVKQVNGDYDYLANPAYYTTLSASVANNLVDVNNNHSSSRYHNATVGNGVGGKNGNGFHPSHVYTNKVLPSSLMSKYTNAGSYIHGGTSMIAATMQSHDSHNSHNSHHISHGSVNQVYYPNQTSISNYGYQKNRYMPYNRTNTTHTSLHQSLQHTPCSVTTSILTSTANYNQFAASVYQTCPPGLGPTITSTTPLSSVSVQAPSLQHTKQSTITTTTQCSSGPTEITYAHTTASSNNVNSNLPNSDNKNSAVSLATAVTTSSSGSGCLVTSSPYSVPQSYVTVSDPNDTITLQITNLDFSMDDTSLKNFLLNQLKPITPVVSLTFEGSSYAKVTVPDLYFAKQVVSNLHRKKIGHKRMLVSYTRDSSLTEINTLRCQVAGLLKDVPCYTLPMYKFRELFQSRFKTSISVLDLYKMQDICIINSDNNEEKFITLHPDLVNSLESSPLMEGLQHSVPYCTIHFKREQHKGWAEQEIEPLPNVFMTISEIQQIIHPLLKNHAGDIPVASLVHCIEGQLKTQITPNENGVNLEHLVCCVQGIQITVNNFGIKILGWLELNKENSATTTGSSNQIYSKNSISDPLYQISREVIELVKMSPKATMKFNRFIPAYHNHFGKQCRVADYGYTKLIELFEALSAVVQIMGDGENRQITLTHRTQIRRFTSDLLRVLRAHGNKSVLLSQLPTIFAQTQNRTFDVTDYGVCDIVDILDGLVNSNIVVVSTVQSGKDILISIPKRKQTASELEKTSIFAGEIVELFRNAPQYTILFQKFVRSYHYHFGYQCRLSDYGFQKLADLMEAVHGIVELELTNDEDKKIYLTSKVARRVFAEQIEELITNATGSSKTSMKLEDVIKLHKKKFGYQITPHSLGVKDISKAIELLPYVEVIEKDDSSWIICHNNDTVFRNLSYKATKYLLSYEVEKNKQKDCNDQPIVITQEEFKTSLTLIDFIKGFNDKYKENTSESTIRAMKHLIEISTENNISYVSISPFMKFLINIIRLLEQRSVMAVHDIKIALDCSINTTFEFGYPNLFTILTAYEDLFNINLGATQERSEITLVLNSELRLTSYVNHKHLFGSLKLSYGKQKNVRSSRPPLGDHNNRIPNTQGPPAKTRAISSDSALYNNNSYSSSSLRSHNTSNYYQQPLRSSSSASFKNYTGGNSFNNLSSSSIYSTSSYHSNVFNTSTSNISNNKENSFNSSTLFNQSFNSSSNTSGSYCDLNSSVHNTVTVGLQPSTAQTQTQPQAAETSLTNSVQMQQVPSLYSTSKLWDRRHGCNIFQKHPFVDISSDITTTNLPALIMPPPTAQVQTQKISISNQTPYLPIGSEASTGLYELVNNIQMCPIYEPPKPDTPPSENMPFWIDPIWTNNNNSEKPRDDLLNIRLPELKALNVLPMLLSPYSLSKTENMKQAFNFDSHDRKIA